MLTIRSVGQISPNKSKNNGNFLDTTPDAEFTELPTFHKNVWTRLHFLIFHSSVTHSHLASAPKSHNVVPIVFVVLRSVGVFQPVLHHRGTFQACRRTPNGVTSYGSAWRKGRDFRLRVFRPRRKLCREIGKLWVTYGAHPLAEVHGRILGAVGFLAVCTRGSYCLCTAGMGGFLVSQRVWRGGRKREA